MYTSQIRPHDRHSRATAAVWTDHAFDHHPRFAEVAMALLPASLILATATALLVALV